MACASNLLAAYGLSNPNKPSTLVPRNSAFISGSSAPPRNMTRPLSLANDIGMCDVSTLIYDSDPKRHCLSYARYVTSALNVVQEAKSTLLVDLAVLLNSLVPLKCVM